MILFNTTILPYMKPCEFLSPSEISTASEKTRQFVYLCFFISFEIIARSQRNVDVINKAIQQFTDYTCLKWVPYGSAEANKSSYSTYIEFISGRYRRLVSTVSDFVAVTLMSMFVNSCALLQWMLVLCW